MWHYQMTDTDCGLCALSNGLMFRGMELDYSTAAKMLQSRGLQLWEYSGYFFYLPLLLADYGLKSTVYLPNNEEELFSFCDKGSVDEKKLKGLIEKSYYNKYAMYFYYESFCQMQEEKKKINIVYAAMDVLEEMKNGKVVLVNITLEEYYNKLIEDSSKHVITLIPQGETYLAVDPYEKLGYREFENWEECLQIAPKYDWSNFHGFAVAF